VDRSKALLDRLSAYQSTVYLGNMSSLLSLASSSTQDIEIKEGNLKLTASQGESPKIVIMYTENNVDFSPKSLSLVFRDGDLVDMIDGYFLFSVGSTEVNISSDRAVTLARNALNNYSWIAEGTTVSDFQVVGQPTVIFHPNTKNSLELYPQYTVTFYLDKVYPGGINAIVVEVWADDGSIAQIKTQNS
jgi:thioredoxin-related protein